MQLTNEIQQGFNITYVWALLLRADRVQARKQGASWAGLGMDRGAAVLESLWARS